MEKNVKSRIAQFGICVGLVCVIWVGYYLVKNYGIDRKIEMMKEDFSWVYQVDSVGIQGKDIILRGFAFELGKDAEEGDFKIVLRDIDSREMYFPKMEYMKRKDVNNYFLCEYDYADSGFEATIKINRLILEGKNYEVLLRISDKRQAYQTGTYISNGELVYTDPTKFEPLDLEGTELEEIVEQGVLRVYRPDYGMYVYQYEGNLYWIAEEEKAFANQNTFIEYLLDTTQIENLPAIRLENKWYSDNIGFKFTENELLDVDTGKYRVAKERLPIEYSIVKVWTGNHTGEWVWREDFRPYYEFE